MPLSVLEQLCYSTVRIECDNGYGQTAFGTGFFFRYEIEGKEPFLAIVTNKHVVQGMTTGKFIMTAANADGEPINTLHYPITVSDIQRYIRSHPAADVDLCALPVAPVFRAADKQGIHLYYNSLSAQLIPDAEQLSGLNVLEDILMIGYPNGLWDKHNNMPILRRGATATHPCLDYEGRKEFLIDAACFPGSSGSPVFIYNPSGYTTHTGNTVLGAPRVLLMGILYGGPQYMISGEFHPAPNVSPSQPAPFLRIPNNLGLVLKASRILELLPFF